jgi:hypothetical protein
MLEQMFDSVKGGSAPGGPRPLRHLEQQTEQARCLSLVTNAVVSWTTEYYPLRVRDILF